MYMRSTIDEEGLTAFALMNVDSDISLDTEELINTFAMKHPRRIKLNDISDDLDWVIIYHEPR